MKYILTGGSGFIGTHFRKKLKSQILMNLDIYEPQFFFDETYIKCDINNFHELDQIKINCEDEITLIHLAAVHFDFQKNYYQTNVNGTENVLKFIEKNKIKNFVFFSSVAIYGNALQMKDEDSVKEPLNDYGKSKLKAENKINEWYLHNPNTRVIVIRPAVVFGPYNFGNVFNLITQIKSGIFGLIGNGKNIKSIAYVENLIDSVLYFNNLNIDSIKYIYTEEPQLTTQNLSKLIMKYYGNKYLIKIPLFLAKILVFPLEILSKLFSINFKLNFIRLEKFTHSTHFNSPIIKNHLFKRTYDLNQCLSKTIDWINKNNVIEQKKIWKKRMEKL